jgi:HEAT repeat protein
MAARPSPPDPPSLVQHLYDAGAVRRDAPRWRRELLRLLAEAGASNAAYVIPHVLPLIGDDDRGVADAASSAVAGILARLSPANLASLDSIFRGSAGDFDALRRGWCWFSPASLQHQLESGRFPPALLGLASMHRSGYVREQAVRRLAERSDGSEIPYLLIRLNDWVPAVREAAHVVLRERLHHGYARHVVRSLTLVNRLAECRRDDHSSFVASVLDRLREPEARPALLEGLSSTEREVRRTCFRLMIEATDISLPKYISRTIRHVDPIIRVWAAQAARARLDDEDYLGLIPIMAGDRFMPIRREALVGLAEKYPDRSRPALMASLLDSHASIREVGRHYLEKSGIFDAPSFYRDCVGSGRPEILPQSIAGLGETGTREDAALVGSWVAHPATKVRQAAIKALGRLDGDSRVDDLLRALEDDRPCVGRVAREALRGRLRLVAGGRLWELFERDRRPHVRRHVLALLAGLGKWARLPYLILACRDDEPAVTAQARALVRLWNAHFNRSFVTPSSDDLRLAAAALDASRAALDPDDEKLLRFHLNGW